LRCCLTALSSGLQTNHPGEPPACWLLLLPGLLLLLGLGLLLVVSARL
jgi:hypothetical protein